MMQKDNTVSVFTGSEVMVKLMQSELDKQGISSLVKNDLNSGIGSGYVSGNPQGINLCVESNNEEKASSIIANLIND